MFVRLAQAIGGVPDAYIAAAVVLPVLFLGWVIVSARRTRHLTQLIRALRGPADPDGPRVRRRMGR
ncbi:hypothetical protein [Phytohabitans suffuscus]|uniref:Uncharacterized protein n=1 Tax=Phytohabitans suffuscus TaxID=624315 RepID=A0A6F8YCL6_9ACTN|nr:hypothetical protein [Phytohabitans suffuscus]BCB83718.1 hypothetical protein Psuf_010310 [Phytohabitans suffuscus]